MRRATVARVAQDAGGAAHFTRFVVGDHAVYPVVAATTDATVVAWTASEGGRSSIRVERLFN